MEWESRKKGWPMNRPVHRCLWFAFSSLMVAAALALSAGCGESEERAVNITEDGKGSTSILNDGEKEALYKDGKRVSEKHGRVHSPHITSDGGLIYITTDTPDDGPKRPVWRVVKNGKPVGKTFERVAGLTEGAGGQPAYAGRANGTWSVYEGDRRVGDRYEAVTPPAVSPDKSSVAFAAEKDGKSFIVKDGTRQTGDYNYVWKPRYGKNDKSLAYVAATDKGCAVFRDGKQLSPTYTRICSWAFGPDGNKLAAVVHQDATFFLVIDGTETGKRFPRLQAFGTPVFSPDGSTVAFAAGKNGNWFVAKGGEQAGGTFPAEAVGEMIFDTKGGSLAWAVKQDGQWSVMKDGRRVSKLYTTVSGLRNSADGASFTFKALRGRRVSQVEVPW
jgi:WD40 repeat protein